MLSRDYAVKDICSLMEVSRAGYYKWKNREPSPRDNKREEIVALVKKVHGEHPTHGYRWTAAYLRVNMQVVISDNYAYKCYRYLGITHLRCPQCRYIPLHAGHIYLPGKVFLRRRTGDGRIRKHYLDFRQHRPFIYLNRPGAD